MWEQSSVLPTETLSGKVLEKTAGQIFKTTASRLVNMSEEEINLMKENAIPRNAKHATKFGMTHFKGKMWKLC